MMEMNVFCDDLPNMSADKNHCSQRLMIIHGRRQCFCFKILTISFGYFDPKMICIWITKINDFWGDLTNISAKTEALVAGTN